VSLTPALADGDDARLRTQRLGSANRGRRRAGNRDVPALQTGPEGALASAPHGTDGSERSRSAEPGIPRSAPPGQPAGAAAGAPDEAPGRPRSRGEEHRRRAEGARLGADAGSNPLP